MSIEIRGATDGVLDAIASALEIYERDHEGAKVTIYRNGPYSIRVRIIDAHFSGMGRADRNDHAWDYLGRLPEDEQADINMLLLVTPDEVGESLGNMEFEDPIPSNWAEV